MYEPQNTKDSPQEQCPNHKIPKVPPLFQLIRVTHATFPVAAYLQFILASLSIVLGDRGISPTKLVLVFLLFIY